MLLEVIRFYWLLPSSWPIGTQILWSPVQRIHAISRSGWLDQNWISHHSVHILIPILSQKCKLSDFDLVVLIVDYMNAWVETEWIHFPLTAIFIDTKPDFRHQLIDNCFTCQSFHSLPIFIATSTFFLFPPNLLPLIYSFMNWKNLSFSHFTHHNLSL